ncbi:SdpA family antimicrobial peptide system protein [Rummeliibacillus sp. SL167]|uniref:SdpA family antimicrobial peptide system protein n=1 Tax=Rummeliibacillus sp. SL167 TaxID=2579792 RepID=UPI0011B6DEBB|nr:SdpA family antimicrobial peptide system protein [Rummeliibacillus sp. SL167]
MLKYRKNGGVKKIIMNNSTYIKTNKTIFIFFFVTVLIGFLVLFYSIVSTLPTSPVSLDKEKRSIVQILYPQSWGFFSKNPRAEFYDVIDANTGEQAVKWPNNRIRNGFGLIRYGRGQGTEIAMLVHQVKNDKWAICKKDSLQCLEELNTEKITINNSTPNPTICGDIGVVESSPIPWAWAKYSDKIKPTSKLVRVKVSCSTS